MSARAKTARSVFRRSLNSWLRPLPSGPVNKNQQPRRKTGINTTLDRFHKLIVDLNQRNAKLMELIENMSQIQNSSDQEVSHLNKEEKKCLLNEFNLSISNHRKSLEQRFKKLTEIEESLSIFRFDEPQPKPPKVEYPPVNPNIPVPRAHLRTSPRFEMANSIAKTENEQLTAKALYLERLIVVQKMKLKLFHDQRELSKLNQKLAEFQNLVNDESSSAQVVKPTSPNESETSSRSPRSNILKKKIEKTQSNSEICEEENVNENVSIEYNENDRNSCNGGENLSRNNEEEQNENNESEENLNENNPIENNENEDNTNENNLNENNENEDNPNENNENKENTNEDADDYDYSEIEDQRLKDSINNLKAAIEHEKRRIKQFQSKYYVFYEAAAKIQNLWRGYNYRQKNKNDKIESKNDD